MVAVVVLGPTAVGKTGLSLQVPGEHYEIVSFDSVQVYRYFDIGSGKPGRIEREKIRHHCIDCVDPDYPFTAGEFCREALKACEAIYASGKIPLFVGGTGLYIDSLMFGISEIPDVDTAVRGALYLELDKNGLPSLYGELENLDPEFAAGIHPNDRQRILRGLEVLRGTGRPLSSFYEFRSGRVSEKTLFIGLYEDRDALKKRIDLRAGRMIEAGLVDEVRKIRGMGYGPGLKPMKSIGYLEINRFLDGEYPLDEAVEKIKKNTAKYAKRQMTWFKKNRRVNWFKSGETGAVHECMARWLCTVKNGNVYPGEGDGNEDE